MCLLKIFRTLYGLMKCLKSVWHESDWLLIVLGLIFVMNEYNLFFSLLTRPTNANHEYNKTK